MKNQFMLLMRKVALRHDQLTLLVRASTHHVQFLLTDNDECNPLGFAIPEGFFWRFFMSDIRIFPLIFERQPILSTEIVKYKFSNIDEIIDYYQNDEQAILALKNANPKLIERIDAYKKGNLKSKKKIRNLFLTLENYLLRMGTRTTPFKLMTKEKLMQVSECPPEKDSYFFEQENLPYYELKKYSLDKYNISKLKIKKSNFLVSRYNTIFIENTKKNEKYINVKENVFLNDILNILKIGKIIRIYGG